jgi:biopolymer transport protein ExbD
MRFRRRADRQQRTKATVDLTPLIDVVFQLLIFFMLSATFVVQTSIPIEMPRAEGAQAFEQRDVTVTIGYVPGGAPGPLYVDEDRVDGVEALSRRLTEAKRRREDVNVLIRCDERVESGRLVEIMGVIKSVGIAKTKVAAQATGEEG